MAKKPSGKKKKGINYKGLFIGAAIGFCCALGAWTLSKTSFAGGLEYLTLDWRFKTRSPIKTLPEVGYVNLDNESNELAGTWPWARGFHATLVSTLKFYDAKMAGYDVFFTESSGVELSRENFQKGLKDKSSAEEILRGTFRDNDAKFEKALRENGNIFLGQFLKPVDGTLLAKYGKKEAISLGIEDNNRNLPLVKRENLKAVSDGGDVYDSRPVFDNFLHKYIGITAPIKRFVQVAKGVGFEQIVPDKKSSTVHLFPLFLHYDKKVYPTLALLIVADILGIDLNDFDVQSDKYYEFTATKPFAGIEPGAFRIPVEKHCRMLMNWSGTYFDTFFHVNFKQLSYYHAYNEAKRMVRGQKITLTNTEKIIADVQDYLRRERLVMEEDSQEVAKNVVLAGLVESSLKLSHDDLLKNLSLFTNKKRAQHIVDSVFLAHAIKAQTKDENIQYLHKNMMSLEELNETSLGLPTSHDSLQKKHRIEIARNILTFSSSKRLEEVSPLYFPPCFKSMVGGREVEISPTMIKDKIFMIGQEGDGTSDLNPQPYQESCAMVALHANAINTMLTGQFLSFTPEIETIAAIFAMAILIGMVCYMLSSRYSLGLLLLLVGGVLSYAFYQFDSHGRWVPMVAPLFATILSYLISMAVQLYFEYRSKQKMKGMFGKMVSPDVLKVMSDDPDLFSLSGRRMACTSFFSSMEGFSHITKGVTPQELIGLLSHYLTPSSQIITSYQGYIDKYEGHIIMADFGVPIPDQDHIVKCLYSSLEQQLDIRAFKTFVQARYGKEVVVSMGVNTGFVSAGNMGSDKKMQYTIMGDTVNTAARFRPANWIYNQLGSVIIGEMTYPVVKDLIQVRMLDKLLLKGKLKPTTIYQVMGWDPNSYLKIHGEVDPTPTLEILWKRCPPEKIYGYAIFWEAQFKKTNSRMAEEIANFFKSKMETAAELLLLEVKGDIVGNFKNFLELKQRFKEIVGQDMHHVESGECKEKLKAWQNLIAEGLKEISKTQDNPEANKLKEELSDVHDKVEALLERLEMNLEIDSHLKQAWQDIEQYLSSDFHISQEDFTEKHSLVFAEYGKSVNPLIESVVSKKEEYHQLMSVVGAITENQKKGCVLFEEGLELQWKRDWPGALEKFQKVLEVMPEDNAALCYMDRMKGYTENPPRDSWQGEFVQTKK